MTFDPYSCEDVSALNEMVDNVYVLNLEKDFFKYKILKKKLNEKNIEHERFIAIDGYGGSLDLEQKEKNFNKLLDSYRREPFFPEILKSAATILSDGYGAFRSEGAMGCLLSHEKIIADAKKQGYEKICIFQDDIYFHINFDKMLEKSRENIKNSAIFYLGATEHLQWLKKERWNDPNWMFQRFKYHHYWMTEKTYGMFAVIIDKKMFDSLLRLMSFNYFAADQCLALTVMLMFDRNGMVSWPNMVMPDASFSNTFSKASFGEGVGHRDFEEHSKKMGWNLNYYDLSERYYE